MQSSSNFPGGPFLPPHSEQQHHLKISPLCSKHESIVTPTHSALTSRTHPGASFHIHNELGPRLCPLCPIQSSVPLLLPHRLSLDWCGSPQALCLQPLPGQFSSPLPAPPPPLGGASLKMVWSFKGSWEFAGNHCWPSCSLWLLEAECQPVPKLLTDLVHPEDPQGSTGTQEVVNGGGRQCARGKWPCSPRSLAP